MLVIHEGTERGNETGRDGGRAEERESKRERERQTSDRETSVEGKRKGERCGLEVERQNRGTERENEIVYTSVEESLEFRRRVDAQVVDILEDGEVEELLRRAFTNTDTNAENNRDRDRINDAKTKITMPTHKRTK